MKYYINRILSNCKKWELCWWWLFRLGMIYAMIQGFRRVPFDITDPLQVGANLAGMFAWEIFMAMPKKNLFRNMPSYIQDMSVVLIFCASFCGKYLNFYYDVRWWDAALHTICGGAGVILGYEVAVCMLKRDKKTASKAVVLLCALGFSFVVSTGWELFEFTFDQISLAGGSIGDAQHWCFELAQGTPKELTLINPVDPARWPIMDTMGDIILNTIGAAVAYIGLKIYPYHHKGAAGKELTDTAA